jgi:hypothetical protein
MPSVWFKKWRKIESTSYRSLGTEDIDGDEKGSAEHLLPSSNSTSSLSSASQSIKQLEEHDDRVLGRRSPRSVRNRALVGANLLLFLSSLGLFIAMPYRHPSELNHAYRQVSTYCKHSKILVNISFGLATDTLNRFQPPSWMTFRFHSSTNKSKADYSPPKRLKTNCLAAANLALKPTTSGWTLRSNDPLF